MIVKAGFGIIIGVAFHSWAQRIGWSFAVGGLAALAFAIEVAWTWAFPFSLRLEMQARRALSRQRIAQHRRECRDRCFAEARTLPLWKRASAYPLMGLYTAGIVLLFACAAGGIADIWR